MPAADAVDTDHRHHTTDATPRSQPAVSQGVDLASPSMTFAMDASLISFAGSWIWTIGSLF